MNAIADSPQRDGLPRSLLITWWVLLAAVLIAVIAARIHLLQVPLERDEGEYAYAGQLMLEGVPPYKLAYNMKFPGTYAAYALIMSIFGQTIAGIHSGLLVVNLATIACLYLLGRALLSPVCGIVSAASYAVLSVSPGVLGFAAHATHFVVLPVVTGIYLLVARQNRPSAARVFGAGACFGAAILMKQPALFFAAVGLTILCVWYWKRWTLLVRQIVVFSVGVVLPFALTCSFLWTAGVFPTFWFWTIAYAREYATLLPVSQGWQDLRETLPGVIGATWPLWLLALIGLVGLFSRRETRSVAFRFLCPLLFFSLPAVGAGLYFREHYFIQLLPALSLLAGAAVTLIGGVSSTRWRRWIGFAVFAAAVAGPLFSQRQFLFLLEPTEVSRVAYGINPFPESIRVAQFIRERTTPQDTIAVVGSEPQIYFYTQRHSTSGFIYMYALMETQPYAAEMQRQMISQIEAARPKYVVFVGFGASWLRRAESPSLIFDWWKDYSASQLTGVGVVNVVSPRQTDYYLPYHGEPVQLAPNCILISERR